MTTQQRVATYRAKNRVNFKKTIELQLSLDECAILDALASNHGMSRVLYTSLHLKQMIINSGYFLSGGKLYSPTL